MLQSVVGRYETSWKRYGVLRGVTDHYGALRNVTGHYGTLRERCGALKERYGTDCRRVSKVLGNSPTKLFRGNEKTF